MIKSIINKLKEEYIYFDKTEYILGIYIGITTCLSIKYIMSIL